MRMEFIELKENSLWEVKFDELSSLPTTSEMIGFGHHYLETIFQKSENFPRVLPVSSELRSDASSRIRSWK